jgi:hypothetical protein
VPDIISTHHLAGELRSTRTQVHQQFFNTVLKQTGNICGRENRNCQNYSMTSDERPYPSFDTTLPETFFLRPSSNR